MIKIETIESVLKEFILDYQAHLDKPDASLKESVIQCMLYHHFKKSGFDIMPEYSTKITIPHGMYDNLYNDTTRTLSIDLLLENQIPMEIKIKRVNKKEKDVIDLAMDENPKTKVLTWIGDDRKLRYLTTNQFKRGYAVVLNKGSSDLYLIPYENGKRGVIKELNRL